jgi:hypothetical protein
VILNCTWPYREAQCPRSFCVTLRKTSEPNVAFCESCLERVFLCRTLEEAEARMQRGERVAKGYLLPGEIVLGTIIAKEPCGE